jgi:hypothetical protein
MSTGNPELLLTLAQRLEDVEREYRRLRRLTVWLLVSLATLLGLGAAFVLVSTRHGMPGTVGNVVSARRFVLRGEDGKIRGIWGTNDDGSVRLVLQDDEERQRTKLDLLTDGAAGFTFADSAGRPRAVFAFLPDQTASLVFADASGKSRSVLGVSAGGSATLVFADQSGATRAGLGVDQRGAGTFTLIDRSGQDATQPEPVGQESSPDTAEATPSEGTPQTRPRNR